MRALLRCGIPLWGLGPGVLPACGCMTARAGRPLVPKWVGSHKGHIRPLVPAQVCTPWPDVEGILSCPGLESQQGVWCWGEQGRTICFPFSSDSCPQAPGPAVGLRSKLCITSQVSAVSHELCLPFAHGIPRVYSVTSQASK